MSTHRKPTESSENEFIETLIGKLSTSWGQARNSAETAGQRAKKTAAIAACNELGLCLELIGSQRVDVVLVAIER
jgi:hypothetical protein